LLSVMCRKLAVMWVGGGGAMGVGAHWNGLKHVGVLQLAMEWKCVAIACHAVSV